MARKRVFGRKTTGTARIVNFSERSKCRRSKLDSGRVYTFNSPESPPMKSKRSKRGQRWREGKPEVDLSAN